MKTEWPKVVPVLTAKMMCKGKLQDGKQHCLVGWRWAVFGSGSDCEHVVGIKMNAAAMRIGDKCSASFNDSNPLPVVAAFWNRIIRGLGRYRRRGNKFHLVK